jgi:hypothetical protein
MSSKTTLHIQNAAHSLPHHNPHPTLFAFLPTARSLPNPNDTIDTTVLPTTLARDTIFYPTCKPSTPLSNCLLGAVWNMQTESTVLYAFDHNCVLIGYNPSVPVPYDSLIDFQF